MMEFQKLKVRLFCTVIRWWLWQTHAAFHAPQAENEALQQLVLEVAQDKANAQSKLAQLRERFKSFIKGSSTGTAERTEATEAAAPSPPTAPAPPQAIPRPVPQVTKGEERPAIPFLPFQPPRMAQQPAPVAPPVPPPPGGGRRKEKGGGKGEESAGVGADGRARKDCLFHHADGRCSARHAHPHLLQSHQGAAAAWRVTVAQGRVQQVGADCRDQDAVRGWSGCC